MGNAQSDCRRGRDECGDFTLVTLLGKEGGERKLGSIQRKPPPSVFSL